jgi:hypothetical protein
VGTTCAVTVDAAKTATATFDEVVFALSVTVDGTGSGAVTSTPSGIDTSVAGGEQADFAEGTVVTLTASADAGSEFAGWGGACATEVGTTCDVTMDAARNAFATFDLLMGTLFFSQDNNANGLYTIDMATGGATLVGLGETGTTSNTIGLAGRGASDPLVGSTYSTLVDIELDGSGASQISTESAEGLTYVASTDLIYAIINTSFRSISPTTGLVVEDLTDPVEDLEGLAADEAAGVIYAVGNDTNLWAYNIQFDAWAIVFDTGINWFLGGLAFSDVEGVLYAIGAGTNEDGVYRIDPVAATVTLVGGTGLAGLNEGGLAWVPSQ